MSGAAIDGAAATARTQQGGVRGEPGDGFVVYRGVPYAAPPVGALRFAPPQPATHWPGVRDARAPAPIAPQNPSRLAYAMGDFTAEQSEDCLTLTIWAPEGRPQRCPVVVWIHGGAFVTGAGSLPWYSGETFARAGIVMVGVNYRLGALGFFHVPGASPGNLGLMDQAAALRWVRDNIAAFGGDPGNVTAMGQSAGGGSIGALMAMPSAHGLFRRAILQSAALQRVNPSLEFAADAGRRFLAALKIDPAEPQKLRDVPVADLLAAQGAMMRGERRFADPMTPFRPVCDGTTVSDAPVAAVRAGRAKGIEMLIGTTREEMAAFYPIDDAVKQADEAKVLTAFERVFGPNARAHYDEYRRMRIDQRPTTALADLFSDYIFRMPSLDLAEAQSGHGTPAYVFQFDWQSPGGFESCHCLELPFTFDNLPHWQRAPMLKGADAGAARLARVMQRAWAAFARSGNPNHDELPAWAPYEPTRRITMRFDTVIEPVGDPAGRSWRLPWPR